MSEELQHHGILGMKWGIRRFQDYDGNYTQRGLERYRQSEAEYDSAKGKYKHAQTDYKLGNISKKDLVKRKQAMQSSKRNLSKSYDSLKKEHTIDRGKELRESGKTITGNKLRTAAVATAFGAAAYATHNALRNSGLGIVTQYGSFAVSSLAPAAIATGGAIVTGILRGKDKREEKKLRAYYAQKKKG